jgi:molybdenum cofactor cytidylyltransferase
VIGGLVLAAGAGTRFGSSPKLVADLDGRPLLEHAVRAQCAVAALDRIVVVLGASSSEVLGSVNFGRAEPIVFAGWQRGQAASLRRGVAELAGARKVIVTLGDAPLVTASVIARFAHEPPGTRALYDGVPGHPVVLGPEQMDAIRSLSGDRGARDLLYGGPTIECGHLCSGRDVDTAEDLEAIRGATRAVL